jgi:deoxyribonuclease-4
MRDRLGAHMSIAGSLAEACHRGREVGCSVVQIFLKNQRQWAAAPYRDDEVAAFRAARRTCRIRSAFAHASYLINLAAPDGAGWARAVDAMHDELERAEALALPYVVVHAGSHLGAGLAAGIRQVGRALDELAARTPGYRVRVLLENTAGAGATVGRTFAELAAMLEAARAPERAGVCLDTCHLYAAGYDLRSRAGYEAAMGECARRLGTRAVRAFHLNDSRAPLGSGLDRHEQIGRGYLGVDPFRRLLNDRRFAGRPMVLETPKDPEPHADRAALTLLRRLVRARTPR